MKNRVLVLVFLCLAFSLVGCAKPPVTELDEMKAIFASLEAVEAQVKTPSEWSEAEGAFRAVQAEVDAQQNKFALFRSYTKTKELILASINLSKKARAAAEMGIGRGGNSTPFNTNPFLPGGSSKEMTCQCRCTSL